MHGYLGRVRVYGSDGPSVYGPCGSGVQVSMGLRSVGGARDERLRVVWVAGWWVVQEKSCQSIGAPVAIVRVEGEYVSRANPSARGKLGYLLEESVLALENGVLALGTGL